MGSPNGIWTAVSGGMAQSQNLDTIANNLANANTTGFKKDVPTFKEYLTAAERPVDPAIDIPRTAFKDSDFYHHDGREHAMVNLNKVHTDHSQAMLKPTSAPFDMAIEGPGFFAVQAPSGIMFTRAGDFKLNSEGQLVTVDGFPVLGMSPEAAAAGAAPPAPATETPAPDGREPASLNPFSNQSQVTAQPGQAQASPLQPISLKDALATGTKVHITEMGQIVAGNQAIGNIALAEFADPKLLKKTTSTLYSNPDAANVPRIASTSQVRQGFLEASNVNPVSELMEMLKANRMYESNMKAIRAYGDMAGKEANEVGKL